jgi:hypothetical protein
MRTDGSVFHFDVGRTFRSAVLGRPEGLHYTHRKCRRVALVVSEAHH